MYKIINYDRWWNYKKTFSNFYTAFMIQQLIDPYATIEYWGDNGREVVWDYKWENKKCGLV